MLFLDRCRDPNYQLMPNHVMTYNEDIHVILDNAEQRPCSTDRRTVEYIYLANGRLAMVDGSDRKDSAWSVLLLTY